MASVWPYPIQFESRRRSLQRFLKSDCLDRERLWFPSLREILKEKFKKNQPLKVAIARTQWIAKNVFVISLIWDKRGIPLYWQLLDKRGSSNLSQQQAVISPILELLQDYEIIIIGEREFGAVSNLLNGCVRRIRNLFLGLSRSVTSNLKTLITPTYMTWAYCRVLAFTSQELK